MEGSTISTNYMGAAKQVLENGNSLHMFPHLLLALIRGGVQHPNNSTPSSARVHGGMKYDGTMSQDSAGSSLLDHK